MRAMVTGSAGHLGKFLMRALRRHGHDPFGFDWQPDHRDGYLCGSVVNPDEVVHAFQAFQPEVVFHLAARVSRVVAEAARGLTMTVNVEGTRVVADACRTWGALMVNISTSEVYGEAVHQFEGATCKPNNWYGLAKHLAEQVVDYYRTMELNAVTIRPFMLYSEEQAGGQHCSALSRFAHGIANGQTITVHEGAVRGWLHMHDMAEMLVKIAEGNWHPVLNIGNEDARPIEELAALVGAELGMEPKIVHTPMPARMTAVKKPDLTFQRSLGLVPTISLEDGIARVCARVVGSKEEVTT